MCHADQTHPGTTDSGHLCQRNMHIIICYAIKVLLFNNCSSLVHVYTMMHVFMDWNFMEVMASAKCYVVSYDKGVLVTVVSACPVYNYWLDG